MNANPNNTATTRQCSRCRVVFPASSEFFHKETRRKGGLSYCCRQCEKDRRPDRKGDPEQWRKMTPEQRMAARARNSAYAKTDKGRAVYLRKAYRRIDECDLTTKQVYDLIVMPCVHCGTMEIPRGLDRVDNSKGHVIGNVAPSCAPCNFARGDRFTFEEMQTIGAVIRSVLQDRKTKQVQNEDHREMSSYPPKL